jgi:hypothetical protein
MSKEVYLRMMERNKLKARRVSVVLSDKQFEIALDLAKKRNQKEARFGAMTYGGKRKSLEAHLIGIVPEMAISIICNAEIDSRIFTDHGDDGVDLVSKDNGVMSIKATTYYDDPYLRVEQEHFREDVNSYILCYYNPSNDPFEIEIIGWASANDVKKGKQQRLLDDGPLNYILTEGELREFVPKAIT